MLEMFASSLGSDSDFSDRGIYQQSIVERGFKVNPSPPLTFTLSYSRTLPPFHSKTSLVPPVPLLDL